MGFLEIGAKMSIFINYYNFNVNLMKKKGMEKEK